MGSPIPIADEAEALDALESSLTEAIAGQSMADVPIGAFLSGGIDSSTIVALYQKYSIVPVRTFSIGFEEAGVQRGGACQGGRAAPRHRSTTSATSPSREARDVIPQLPAMYDEPFADSSQIPTHLVSRFAREQVTVAMSGDGGDELFGGYNRYLSAVGCGSGCERMPDAASRRARARRWALCRRNSGVG